MGSAGASAATERTHADQGKKESKQRVIKSSQASGRTARGAVGGVVTPTPELAHVVGSKPLSFDGNDKLSMFEMTAYISKHLLK